MIVPTMTPEEIQHEIAKDFEFLAKRVIDFRCDWRKKSSRLLHTIREFPYNHILDVQSKITNIKYRIVLTANNKYRLKDPLILIYTSYSHEVGTTFVCMTRPHPEHPEIELFTPHFLKRYYERMHFQNEYTLDQLFQRYWQVNLLSDEIDGILVDDAERYYHDENTEYYGKVIQEGLVVCERDKRMPSIEICNTFISPDLFFANQEDKVQVSYITQLWLNFSQNYPRQKKVLDEKFLNWVHTVATVEELHAKVNDFIRNY